MCSSVSHSQGSNKLVGHLSPSFQSTTILSDLNWVRFNHSIVIDWKLLMFHKVAFVFEPGVSFANSFASGALLWRKSYLAEFEQGAAQCKAFEHLEKPQKKVCLYFKYSWTADPTSPLHGFCTFHPPPLHERLSGEICHLYFHRNVQDFWPHTLFD